MTKEAAQISSAYSGMTPEQVKKFKYWELRTMLISIFGYALFYFVRKNLSIAMPYLNSEMGISKGDLGLFLTLHGLVYGLSKFINGIWGDRSNARNFLVAGIVLCSVCNIFFGLSSSIVALGIFWVLNGWFQGMGVPPCTRLITHWVVPERLATKMSIWNMSHSIGAGLAIIFCGYMVTLDWGGMFGSGSMFSQHWRWCFLVPALITLIGAAIVWIFVRDTPSSVGLPELSGGKEYDEEEAREAARKASGASKAETKAAEAAEHRAFIKKHVFMNPVIWILVIGNFFVYIVRFTVLDWGPTMLKEHYGMDISSAGWTVAAFEVAGLAGMLAAGWITDHVFGGRGPRTCVICMIMTMLCMIGLCFVDENTPLIVAILILVVSGFFIYGPQALVGIAAANIATKRAAATAVGLCGLFGYASTVVSGWGLGLLVQYTGWDIALYALVGVALVGAIILAFAWKAKPNGYEA